MVISMIKKISLKNVLVLQSVVIIYSISSVIAKLASGQDFLTMGFFLFYGLEIIVLGIYAIAWQQAIKKFDLSVAYANKAMTLLWAMLWSVLLFHEGITVKKVCGTLLVITGTVIINSGNPGQQIMQEAENS